MNFESVLLLYLFHTAKASFVAWGSWVLQHELRLHLSSLAPKTCQSIHLCIFTIVSFVIVTIQ